MINGDLNNRTKKKQYLAAFNGVSFLTFTRHGKTPGFEFIAPPHIAKHINRETINTQYTLIALGNDKYFFYTHIDGRDDITIYNYIERRQA